MATHLNRGALAPGQATPERPQKDETRELGGGAGFEVQETANDQDCAAGETAAEVNKAFATVRATLALRGFELHAVSDGDGGTMFLVQRWNQSRTLASLADVRAFARQVGAMPC
jgi:hypothetical protein